jgi:hypothetical protein
MWWAKWIPPFRLNESLLAEAKKLAFSTGKNVDS